MALRSQRCHPGTSWEEAEVVARLPLLKGRRPGHITLHGSQRESARLPGRLIRARRARRESEGGKEGESIECGC